MISLRPQTMARRPLLLPLVVAVVVVGLLAQSHTTDAFNEPESKAERRKRLAVPQTTTDLIHWMGTPETGGFYYHMLKELTRDYQETDIEEFRGPRDQTHGTYAILKDVPDNGTLMRLPFDKVLGGDIATSSDDGSPPECRLIQSIYKEVTEHGEESAHAPHLRYLGLLPGTEPVPPKPPALWSDAGRKFLEELGQLPSDGGINRPLVRLARMGCLQGFEDGPLATRIAMAVAIHGAAPSLVEDHGILVPLLDNHHYAHCGNDDGILTGHGRGKASVPGSTTNAEPNTHVIVDPYYTKSVYLVTSKKIPAMDQICRPFDSDRTKTATEKLVDLGISDSQHYPKTFVLDVEGLEHGVTIEVTHKPSTGSKKKKGESELVATVTSENRRTEDYFEKVAIFLEDELRRLRTFEADGEKKKHLIPRAEYQAVLAHHQNLVLAMHLAYDVLDEQELEEDEEDGSNGGEL